MPLQVLVNTAFRRDARGDRHYVIDALGYPQGQGRRAAADGAVPDRTRSRRTDVPQEIGPLNPYARRIVHLVGRGGSGGVVRERRRRVPEDASSSRRGSAADRRRRSGRSSPSGKGSHVFSTADTIVAIATPPGRGGIGVVRLSGGEARRIARAVARAAPSRSHRGTRRSRGWSSRGRLEPRSRSGRGHLVRGAAIRTRARTSSRSARTAALSCCDGSSSWPSRPGARLAEPGEFTLRAYLNGRLDSSRPRPWPTWWTR